LLWVVRQTNEVYVWELVVVVGCTGLQNRDNIHYHLQIASRCFTVAKLELFGTASCPYTQEMREWLEWKRSEFVEYDVEQNPAARERLLDLVQGQGSVPVLVEDGRVIQIGWQGRACVLGERRSG
jgi:glutaredoxin